MATFMATVPVSSSFLRQTSVFFNFKKFSKNNVSYFLSMYLSRDSMYNFPKTSVEYLVTRPRSDFWKNLAKLMIFMVVFPDFRCHFSRFYVFYYYFLGAKGTMKNFNFFIC